jgi:hypothetical protein
MISRKSAKLIADIYGEHFKSYTSRNIAGEMVYSLKESEIRDFFYENDYEPWFLSIMKGFIHSGIVTPIKRAIMGLHTGETQAPATSSWEESQRLEIGQNLLKKLAEDILKLYDSIPEISNPFNPSANPVKYSVVQAAASAQRPADEILRTLKAQLELDGYVYREGTLFHTESSVIDEQAEQSYLEELVDLLQLTDTATVKHHIRLAEEDYVNNRWSNSIGNSRHFLEAILSQVLQRISTKLNLNLNQSIYRNATDTRNHLERNGLLTSDERDTIGRIYGLLSNIGGHAYIAQKDQARLMWHLALTCSQFVLLRYEGFLKANP